MPARLRAFFVPANVSHPFETLPTSLRLWLSSFDERWQFRSSPSISRNLFLFPRTLRGCSPVDVGDLADVRSLGEFCKSENNAAIV